MSEKEKKYPLINLNPNGTYEIYIEEGVKVVFDHIDGINNFVKDKSFEIEGVYCRPS